MMMNNNTHVVKSTDINIVIVDTNWGPHLIREGGGCDWQQVNCYSHGRCARLSLRS